MKIAILLLMASAAFGQSGGPAPVVRGTLPQNAPCVGTTNTSPPTLTTGACGTVAKTLNLISGDNNGNGVDSGIPTSVLITTSNSNTLSATRLTGITFNAGTGISFGTSSFPNLTISTTGSGCPGCLVPPASLQGTLAGGTGSTNTIVTSLLASLYSSSTGIASAEAACGSSTPCNIVIPPSYTTSERIAGMSLDPNNPAAYGNPVATANIAIGPDLRYGFGSYFANNNFGQTQGYIATLLPMVQTASIDPGANAVVSLLGTTQFFYDAGGVMNSQQNSLYSNKTTQSALTMDLNSYIPSQHILFGGTLRSYSVGDAITHANYLYSIGGLTSQADEGEHLGDDQAFEVPGVYTGTISGTPGGNATVLTIAVTSGGNTQGSYRQLVDKTTGVISAGSISAITTPGNALTTVTGSGTSWPVSTVAASLGTTVSAPGSVTVTPSAYIIGSISGITTSSKVCVSDGSSFERVQPSAVSGSTFTATFLFSHVSSATISVGGLCGFLLDLTADDATNSTFTSKLQTITGTLRYAWPVVYSTSSTSAVVAVYGGGQYFSIVSRWNASTANGYVLYPYATVTSVQASGGLSNTLTTEPNSVAWSTGDAVELLNAPQRQFSGGNKIIESYYPNPGPFAGGAGYQYNMPLQGNDTMWGLVNGTLFTMYTGNGGTYSQPYGVHLKGISRGFSIDGMLPATPAFSAGCNVSGTGYVCSGLGEWGRGTSAPASSYHSIFNDETNGGWLFQTHYSTGNSFAVDWDPTYSISYAGPYQDQQIWLGDPVHTFPGGYFYEQSSCANNPESGALCLYANTDGKFHTVNSSGTDVAIGTGGGSLPTTGTQNGTWVPAAQVTLGAATSTYNATLITPMASCAALATSYTVTGATNASPIVIATSVAHGLFTGDQVLIASVGGNTAANAQWTITLVDATHFSLNSSTGNAAYTSGGTAQNVLSGPCVTAAGTATGFFTYVLNYTGTSINVPASMARGLMTFNNGSAVSAALPQCGTTSGYVQPGDSMDFTNYGAGAVTLTASGGSLIGPSLTSRIISASSGSAPVIYHTLHLTCDGTNFQIGLGSN